MFPLFFFLTIFALSPFILFLIYSIPLLIFSFFEKPTFKKKWIKIHERIPEFNIDDLGNLFVRNVRDATYQSTEWHSQPNWQDKVYKIKNLQNLYIFLNPYGFLQTHPVLSFDFGDDNYLCISFEIRKTDPKSFNVFKVFYKNYESIFIAGTERDLIRVRTNFRKHQKLYAFRIPISQKEIEHVLREVVKEAKVWSRKPMFYRILNRNCVSEIYKILTKASICKKVNRVHYLFVFNLFNKQIFSNFFKSTKTMKIKTRLPYEVKHIKPDENYSKNLHKFISENF